MEKKYPIGGYAPGNYHCTCATCGGKFIGDKRAVQCEPCALDNKAKFDKLSPEEQEALVKRNAGIAQVMIAYKGSGDQIVANQVAGMPLEEAIYQAGYSSGHDIGYERGKREATPQGIGWVKASTWPERRHNDVHWRRVSDKRPLLVIGRNYQENIIAQFGKVYTPEELEWLDEGTSSRE